MKMNNEYREPPPGEALAIVSTTTPVTVEIGQLVHCDLVTEPTQFDYDAVDADLLAEDERNKLAEALHRVLEFIVGGREDYKRKVTESVIARRAIAAMWTIDPYFFADPDHTAPNLTELAKVVGLHKVQLSEHAAAAAAAFGVRNTQQIKHHAKN